MISFYSHLQFRGGGVVTENGLILCVPAGAFDMIDLQGLNGVYPKSKYRL